MRRCLGWTLAALLTVGLTGCGGTGLTFGRRGVSACYKSLPVALRLVHDPDAHLVGVHRLPLSLLHRRDGFLLSAWPAGDRPVCAVALEGSFAAGQVPGVAPALSGHYAVILVDDRSGQVLAATVTNRLPRRLLGRTY